MAELSRNEERRERARKHATTAWTCSKCGRTCRGNGGKSSHRRWHHRAGTTGGRWWSQLNNPDLCSIAEIGPVSGEGRGLTAGRARAANDCSPPWRPAGGSLYWRATGVGLLAKGGKNGPVRRQPLGVDAALY